MRQRLEKRSVKTWHMYGPIGIKAFSNKMGIGDKENNVEDGHQKIDELGNEEGWEFNLNQIKGLKEVLQPSEEGLTPVLAEASIHHIKSTSPRKDEFVLASQPLIKAISPSQSPC
jgi:hypothetical protein